MITGERTKLDAQIECVNTVHAIANRLARELAAFMKPKIETKVVLATGRLPALLEKNLDRLLKVYRKAGLTIVLAQSRRFLAFNVQAHRCYPYGGGMGDVAVYHQVQVVVGRIKDGVLREMIEWSPLKCDYTTEEIRRLREACELARKTYHESRAACEPFV